MRYVNTNFRPPILLAEPAAASAALVRRQLEWAGYEVIVAVDGAEALEQLAEQRPLAAVLEVTMARKTGYEVVRALRLERRNRLMPVILMSQRAGKLDRDFAFTVGADDYFKKPFRCSDLVARLTELLPLPVPAPAPEPIAPAARMPLRLRGVERKQPALAAR